MANSKQQAKTITAELKRIETRTAREVRVLAQQLMRGVLRSFRAGQLPEFAGRFVERMLLTLKDSIKVAYLSGARRSELSLQGKLRPAIELSAVPAPLSLGVHDVAIRFLESLLDADVDAIEQSAETQALRILQGESTALESELQAVVRELIASGAHVREGVATLRETFDRLGISPTADYRLEATFRTQNQLAYGAGRFEAYQDPAVDEILWGYEYVTAGDDRVRPSHAAMDGARYPKDHEIWQRWWPPNGWNCRCTVIPVFVDEVELATVKPPQLIDGLQPEVDQGFAFNAGRLIGGRVSVVRPESNFNIAP